MSEEKDRFEKVFEELKTQRDEIRVRLHLAGAEVKDEWDELEKKWEQDIKPKLGVLVDETAHTSRNIFSALELAADEIKDGYKRIKKRLS